LPRFDHVLVLVMENHAFTPIIGNPDLPYINALAAQGASFTQSFAVTHPSQPNYIALFSGSTQGVANDDCPFDFIGRENLASQLLGAHMSFAGYAEDQPWPGYTGCKSEQYARKHIPWIDFDNVPRAASLPLAALPADYSKLPTVAFVVPNLCNDMHNCAPAIGDAWLSEHVERYAQWAKSHNSLLIVTFDEDDFSDSNRVPTLFVGAHVKPGEYAESIDHYRVLATIEAMYGLEKLGSAAALQPITSVWKPD
jgi:acid phosphatase